MTDPRSGGRWAVAAGVLITLIIGFMAIGGLLVVPLGLGARAYSAD